MMSVWGDVMGSAMDLKPQKPLQYIDVSAKAVIFLSGRVLLLRRPNGRWDLPGGKTRPRERVVQALQREVREETGLTLVRFDHLSHVHRRRPSGRDCLVVTFHCTPEWPKTGKFIELSSEHEGFAFFGYGQTDELRLREYHKQAINIAWHQVCLVQAA